MGFWYLYELLFIEIIIDYNVFLILEFIFRGKEDKTGGKEILLLFEIILVLLY